MQLVNGLHLNNIRGDIFGGLTAAVVALPLALAFGVSSGAGPIASNIPHVVLAGILIKVGTDIIDWDYLKRVHISPAPGVEIMFTVLIITVFVDLFVAVAAGMTMASMLYLKRHSDMQLSKINIQRSADEESLVSTEEVDILNRSTGPLLLFHISGPMSFGAAKGMVNNTLNAGRKVVVALPPGEPCAMLDRENILDALPMHYRHIDRLSALRFANRLLVD